MGLVLVNGPEPGTEEYNRSLIPEAYLVNKIRLGLHSYVNINNNNTLVLDQAHETTIIS